MVLVIVGGTLVIVTVASSLSVVVVLLLSMALIVKLDEPVVVGVPLRMPLLVFNDNYDGKLPALTE